MHFEKVGTFVQRQDICSAEQVCQRGHLCTEQVSRLFYSLSLCQKNTGIAFVIIRLEYHNRVPASYDHRSFPHWCRCTKLGLFSPCGFTALYNQCKSDGCFICRCTKQVHECSSFALRVIRWWDAQASLLFSAFLLCGARCFLYCVRLRFCWRRLSLHKAIEGGRWRVY